MLAHERLESAPSVLDLWVASRLSQPVADHALLLVHGLPRAYGMGRNAAGLLPELAEQLAQDSGWTVATVTLSGIGQSTGTFSVDQWRRDLTVAVDWLSEGASWVSLCGFGLGSALALERTATDERVRGVASFAGPSDMDHWIGHPADVHRIVVAAGAVDPTVPLQSSSALAEDLRSLHPLAAAARVPPKRFLIGHGTEDREVPVADARALFDAAEGRAELRVIQGAGHWLRADPRMVATLLGWLDRQR